MGSNGQAVSEDARSGDGGAGFDPPGSFPFVVLSGEAVPGGRTSESNISVGSAELNPIFEAFVRRPAPAGRTARQALVQALAEIEGPEPRAEAWEDFSSYGVTRAPLAGATKELPVAVAAPVSGRSRKPRLDSGDTAPPSAPVSSAPVLRENAPAPVVRVTPDEVAVAPANPVAGKTKMALRRPGSGTRPAVPTDGLAPEMSFPAGPMMEGTRAPLMPLPGLFGSAPFPALAMAGEATVQDHPGMAPLAGEKPVVKAGSTGRSVWWGRVAVAGVIMAFLVLGAHEWRERQLWPFQADRAEVVVAAGTGASAAGATSVTPFWTVEVTGGRATPAFQPGERPAPTHEFLQMVEQFKITGVLQTDPVRAIMDGRIVAAGDMVEVTREVRLVGLDREKHLLIFEDKTTARATVRYR